MIFSCSIDQIELQKADSVFNIALENNKGLISPTYRFRRYLTRFTQTQNATLNITCTELTISRELLGAYTKHKRGKRDQLAGKLLFSTTEILEIT